MMELFCRNFLEGFFLFCSADGVVQVFDEGVDVNAVSHSALLDVLKVSGSAAEAAHAGIHEYINGVRIFLDDLENAHIFSNCHNI